MRFLILFIFLFLFDWYAFQAFQYLAEDWSMPLKITLYGLYWLFPLLAAVLLVLEPLGLDLKAWKNAHHTLRAIVVLAYMSKFLIVVVLLVDDLRRVLYSAYIELSGAAISDNARSPYMANIALSLGGIPFLILTYGIIRNRYRYKVFRERVKIAELPKGLEGLRIVQISDIHSGSFSSKKPLLEGIKLINQEKPDLVFFTGDLVNSVAAEMRDYVDVFDKIEARYGVFSITGNHDYGDYVRWDSVEAKGENFRELIDTHRKMGWDLMLNENRMVEISGEKVAIIGVENFSGHARFSRYGNLEKAYKGTENAALKLLLSHDPSHWGYQVLSEFKDIAITFSGHTHGFQFGIEIPGGMKWSPIKYVYKEWAGLYQKGTQYLYVNRGFGFLGYPGRVGILPEITVMELTRGPE